ncbi:MAG: pyroglutamyl-peptidase I [Caldisericia bacterium]|nr:pyroglutamyl-peptidase I [Caldisericia bacterium]MDD4614163.1 pyroglutamyl-peptidase I [Caldisericia bacterium]
MSNTLVYSFAPFGNLQVNPAAEIATKIQSNQNHCSLCILPVTFGCQKELLSAFLETKPDRIIGFGVAAGIPNVHVECYALNEIHARIPDNEGNQPSLVPILQQGPSAYRTHMDVEKIVTDLHTLHIPAALSFHAGLYVCNYSYYWTLHLCHLHQIQGLFIHVPLSPEEAIRQTSSQSSFPTSMIAEALTHSLFS